MHPVNPSAPSAGVPLPRRKMRGARPTPKELLQSMPRFHLAGKAVSQFAVVPPQLSIWGNADYGDCVTAEEAFACACYQPEFFVPDSTVIQWAQAHGVLNGADLLSVLQMRQQDPFTVGPNALTDGVPMTVDYTNETVLQAAIAQHCPVKLGIDANALPNNAGDANGWYALGGGKYTNEDHCVGLCGYGLAVDLYRYLGVPLPGALPSNTPGYLLFTWNSIGFVDFAWLQSTVGEAWVRSPTTVVNGPTPPPPPPPPPGPGPTPTPSLPATFASDVPAGNYSLVPMTAEQQRQLSDARLTPDQWKAIIALVLALIQVFVNPPPPPRVPQTR